MEAERAGRVWIRCISCGASRTRHGPRRVPLFDEESFVAGEPRIVEPLMRRRVLGEVVLTDSVAVVDFEDDEFIGLDGLRAAK